MYTRKINFEQKVRGHLFQERFYSTPLDEVHLLHAIKYVEQNPVKAFMVKHPWDYKYSSARYRLNLVEEDKLLSNCTPIDRIVNYKEFLQENVQIKFIKEKTRTGKPCGDDEFYDKIKSLIGIDYKNKKAGRPKKDTHKFNEYTVPGFGICGIWDLDLGFADLRMDLRMSILSPDFSDLRCPRICGFARI